jgi:hypothetical protein
MSRFEKFDNMDNPEKVKEFLRRDAIVYTLFEKRSKKIGDYFGNERFGLREIFREFEARTNGQCTIERIKILLDYAKKFEILEATRSFSYMKHRLEKDMTTEFEEYFSINYPLLDFLFCTSDPKYSNVFQYLSYDIDEPECIGEPKKEYSSKAALEAMKELYGRVITFEGTYLDLPVIAPRGQMRLAEGSASVVIDFSKPDQEIIDYVLKIKQEIHTKPSIVNGFDRLVDEEPIEKISSSASDLWDALRSHKTNDGKDLSTRWADMLFMYDCERYGINDETYIKNEIDRYWHQKNPQINNESYGNAICREELKTMLADDFQKESDEVKAKFTNKYDDINWAKYGLSKANKIEKIKAMILSYWNEESEENKYPHYAGKIRTTTYDRNQILIREIMDGGKISLYMYGVDLSELIKP